MYGVDVGMGIEALVEPKRLLVKLGSGIGCGTVGGVTYMEIKVRETSHRQRETGLIKPSWGGEDDLLRLTGCR